MLTQEQRERILHHLEHGWKLPDSLAHELWAAYEALERAQAPRPQRDDGCEGAGQGGPRRESRAGGVSVKA